MHRYLAPSRLALAGVVGVSAYAILAGLTSLVGWVADLPRLTDWDNDGISMFVNTAICAILAGATLVMRAYRRRVPQLIPTVTGGVLFVFAGLIFSQHITGVNLGIDTLMWSRSWGQGASTSPMRIGPPASLSFMLIGASTLLMARPGRGRLAASCLGVLVLAIAMISLVGYLYGMERLYAMPRFTGIAFQTATVIFAVGIGVVLCVPERGLSAIFRRPDAGGVLARRLILPIVFVPFFIGWVKLQYGGEDAASFGTAARTVLEIAMLLALLAWTSRGLSRSSQLLAERARLLDLTADAILIRDHADRIQYWNRGAEELYGYSAREALGRQTTELLATELPLPLEEIHRALREQSYWQGEVVHRCKDGTRRAVLSRWAMDQASPMAGVRVLESNTDITLRRAGEESLRAALDQTRHAARMKDEFLATLSHELRTPMTAIQGWAQLLRGKTLPAEAQQGIEVIERNARLQSKIIEDLLDMSRIISGKIRLDVQSVRIHEIVGAAMEAIRPAAAAKGLRLTLGCDPGTAPVRGDPSRIQQVVYNLLTNAVKFTPAGGEISVRCVEAGGDVEVRVVDTGAGITPEFLPHVFERFRQQDASSTRRYQGLGLGLAIVKHIVELHGGRVHAMSDGEGRGATFVVALPKAGATPGAAAPAGSAVPAVVAAGPSVLGSSNGVHAPGVQLAGRRILVVDDEVDARELIAKVLESHGARVTMAGSASEALERLRAASDGTHPELLICDIGMPLMDGHQLVRAIRSLPAERGGRIPAIALTAFARPEDRARSLQAGFQLHLTKPVEIGDLLAGVERLGKVAVG